MTKVYLWPHPNTIEANSGIGRIVHAQYRLLPGHGIELVGSENEAEVVACHTQHPRHGQVDVLHLHGLYWTGDGYGIYNKWHRDANTNIVESCRRAKILTVPSRWVAEPFLRDMRRIPVIIGHGLDLSEWGPGSVGRYWLWNKNRNSDVCDPTPAWELARSGIPVISTFAPRDRPVINNLRLTGALPHSEMRELIRNAFGYLATTKETMGIGTLEALASGVPVIGYRWGGTEDLIVHRVNGWLAEPGDVEGLRDGVRYVQEHRSEMSAKAMIMVQAHSWDPIIEKYAQTYRQAAGLQDQHRVAVVITNYNYGPFLTESVQSALNQTRPADEVIVVDDGSTDNSMEVLSNLDAKYPGRLRVLSQVNKGVAAARNLGVAEAEAEYVVCLDADDRLADRYLECCLEPMQRDRGVGISFTGMSLIRPEGSSRGNIWTGSFDWNWQAQAHVPPHTCVPTAAMFRKEMWRRVGGYRQEYAPGEDAEFYTRGLSVGFTVARSTMDPLLEYRDHGVGAHKQRPYVAIDNRMPWMRDGHFPLAVPSVEAPSIRSYSDPKVSVIIPVGPGHARFLASALESLLGQTMREWEAIVVFDADEDDFFFESEIYPFIRTARAGEAGNPAGPGAARNVGLALARAPLCLFLDADDELLPSAFDCLCRAYSSQGGKYVYGDMLVVDPGQPPVERRSPEFSAEAWLDFDNLDNKHHVSALLATSDIRAIGGFDESLTGWEDWELFAHLVSCGVQGVRVPAVTNLINRHPDSRTARLWGGRDKVARYLKEKFGGSKMEGGSNGKGCGCGSVGAAIVAARKAYEGVPPPVFAQLDIDRTVRGKGSRPVIQTAADGGLSFVPVRMEFTGRRTGAVTYVGQAGSGRQYRGGNNPSNKYANVHPDDVESLLKSRDWQKVGIITAAPVSSRPIAPKPGPAPVPVPVPADRIPADLGVEEIIEDAGTIQTATGRVRRKKVVVKGKNTPMRDLPSVE